MMRTIFRDVRYSVRTLLHSPGFTAVAILALALGIGANSAIYSLVNAVFLRPFPYADPSRLVEICEHNKTDSLPVDYLDYLEWRSQSDVFERMAFQATFSQTLTGAGLAETIQVGFVTADFFRTLGVRPTLGRDLSDADDQRSASPVAILAYNFWQGRFAGRRDVLGRTIRLGQRDVTVIGVLPASFRFHRPGQAYVAFGPFLRDWGMDLRGNHNNAFVMARLKEGVSVDRAQTQMNTITRRLELQFPGLNTDIGAKINPLRQLLTGGVRGQMLTLLGAVGFVLLIACVNVANLMLARSARRRPEIVIRAALGAGRLRLASQLLVESLVLSVSAALLGLLIARMSLALLARLVPWGFEAGDVRIDGPVLAFTLAVACATALVFGIFPALNATRFSLIEALKEGGRGGESLGAKSKLRRALVIAQVAISMVLLAGAGLLVRSFSRLMNTDPGFETEHLLTMNVNWSYWETAGPRGAVDFEKSLAERVRALPGVKAAGVIWPLPLDWGMSSIPFYRADRPIPAQGKLPVVRYYRATPDVFPALGVPLVRGRLYTTADGHAPPAGTRDEVEAAWRSTLVKAVISESMARRYWPGEDPVGARIRFGPAEFNGPWVQIVGVVGDVRGAGLDQPLAAELYLNAYQDPSNITLVVRSHGDPSALASSIRRTVSEMDRNTPVSDVRTMDEVIAGRVASRRTNTILIGSFAVLAMVLAAVGLYGVMAYMVGQRRHEIGIRMALGARPSQVLTAVLREAGLVVVAGVWLGTVGALALTRVLTSLLFGVEPTDPASFAGAALILIGVSGIASWMPARRAAAVDPVIALRYE